MHGGLANDVKVDLALRRQRGARARRTRAEKLGGFDAHPGARRLRRSRHRGQDPGDPLRARDGRAVLRHLPRHAAGGDRVRAPRVRPARAPPAKSSSPTASDLVIAPDARPAQGASRRAASMRLGAYPCMLKPGSLAADVYGTTRDQRAPPPPLRGQQRLPRARSSSTASASPACRPTAAWSRSSSCPSHPYFLGCQFHPEFKSKPARARTRCSCASWRRASSATSCATKHARSEPAGAMVH